MGHNSSLIHVTWAILRSKAKLFDTAPHVYVIHVARSNSTRNFVANCQSQHHHLRPSPQSLVAYWRAFLAKLGRMKLAAWTSEL